MTRLLCVNDFYDPDGSFYDDIEDFQAMCLGSFGMRATLTHDFGPGVYYDETGAVVLREVDADDGLDESCIPEAR